MSETGPFPPGSSRRGGNAIIFAAMQPGVGTGREGRIVDAFVDLADSLVADYDQLDFLYRLLEHGLPLVGADAGGVLLHYEGSLHLVASSSEASEDLEAFEVQNAQGPARDAFHTGEHVRVDNLAEASDRWPGLCPGRWRPGGPRRWRIRSGFVTSFSVRSSRSTRPGRCSTR